MLHRFILDPPPHLQVDHINGDPLDNRRANLRLATNAQNAGNSLKRKRATSRYKGVSWFTAPGKWGAQIIFQGKSYWLGRYVVEEDAARAYDRKALEFFGEFARLNFPEDIAKYEALRRKAEGR